MPRNFNIDIHCHPSTKPFLSPGKKNAIESFNHVLESGLIKAIKHILEKKAEVLLATQSNFDHLFEGGHEVVIASITPMERAFLVARMPNTLGPILEPFIVIDNQIGLEDTIRPKLINALMGFSIKRIEFVRDALQLKDYFNDSLVPEYNFLVEHNNKKSLKHGFTIKFVKHFGEIEDGMANAAPGEKTIYVLLSIEGAHSFRSKVPSLIDIQNSHGHAHTPTEMQDMSDAKMVEDNIREMKQWEFVPFYVTLMHHFWNGMGGHARSLNKLVGKMVNQDEGINERLTLLGKLVIHDLLQTKYTRTAAEDVIETVTVPRVLIDIKHMSVSSRMDYYEMLDTEFAGEDIPIICSHTGIADTIDSFEDLLKVDDKREEENNRNYFHKARINLCGADVRRIVKSKGLIGIQMDEKRVAGAGFIKSKLNGGIVNLELMNEYAKLIMANIFLAVKAANTLDAWNVFCIGSDFDGLINHLDVFPTSGQMPVLRDEIEFFLNNLTPIKEPQSYDFEMSVDEMKRLMMNLTPEEITSKIFSENVMNFLSIHFRR